ncbi:MAG: hypothetical protein R6V40_01195 [Candidatus Moraniibacteriota bacterium]
MAKKEQEEKDIAQENKEDDNILENLEGELKQEDHKENDLSKMKIIALLALGFFVGIMFKSQALKSFAVGYDDYKLTQYQSDYPKVESDKEKQSPQEKLEIKDDVEDLEDRKNNKIN